MQVFVNSADKRASAGPEAAAEAGLLGVVQLSRVVERCHNVPLKRGMDRRLDATTPRADTTGSSALSSAWLVLVLVLHNCAVTVSSTGAGNQFQADDNGHVGRPCEVSLAPPYPELFASYGASAVTRHGTSESGRGHVA
jgi:hypothetical protein